MERQEGGKLAVSVQGQEKPLLADAVVLAVGATSAAKLVAASPALASLETTGRFDKLRGITCVAVRLFLKPATRPTTGLRGGLHDQTVLPALVARAMEGSPVLVVGPGVGGIPQLKETGFCVYDLQRMHDEHAAGQASTAGIAAQSMLRPTLCPDARSSPCLRLTFIEPKLLPS